MYRFERASVLFNDARVARVLTVYEQHGFCVAATNMNAVGLLLLAGGTAS